MKPTSQTLDGADGVRKPLGTPDAAALKWILGEHPGLWLPLAASVLGQWLESALQVTVATVLGWASMRVTDATDTSIGLPWGLDAVVGSGSDAVGRALLLALGFTVVAGILDILVAWTLTWGHASVLPSLTRAALQSLLPARGMLPLEASTAIQRWLLKSDVSRFVVGTVAQFFGALGSVVIVVVAAWRATPVGGGVATAGLLFWIAVALPIAAQAIRATRNAAVAHEVTGSLLRATSDLGESLWHAPHERRWVAGFVAAIPGLRRAVQVEGAWGSLMFGGLTTISNALPLVVLLAVAATGNLGTMVSTYLYVSRLTGPLGGLASTLPNLQQELVSIQRVYEAFKRPGDASTGPVNVQGREVEVRGLVAQTASAAPAVRYRDYVGGGLIAVVGPTGSGKSTLLRVLAGIVVPQAGRVTFGGMIPDGTDAWREQCALMPQEPGLIRAAAGAANSPSVLGLMTAIRPDPLGDDKGGGAWSVGERRARALGHVLSTGAPLLLLDEPLAGMDADLARLAAAAMREAASQGRTVVVALHERDVAVVGPDVLLPLWAENVSA